MRAKLVGGARGPAAVVVGAWDPFLPAHREMLEHLRSRVRERSLMLVAVLLEPAPPVFIWGRHDWPVFDEVNTRVNLLIRSGVDGVLLVRILRADVAARADTFLSTVHAHVDVAELWLGAHQTLGGGSHGREAAILEFADLHGFGVHRLPPVRLATEDVRKFLAAGRLHDAVEVAGRVPVRKRPRTLSVRLAWLPGRYRAVALEHNSELADIPTDSPVLVELEAQARGLPRLAWPDPDIRYLAFVGGPADDAGR